MFTDYPDLAATDQEAAQRFALTKNSDPFPEIPAALLNSADVMDYVRLTGLLYPFHKDKLKSASYEAAIQGTCFWCDDRGEQHEVQLEEGKAEELILRPNSITFVQVEPFFRLPLYLALRFNLKITHVHRGILLGTGPLVDPGFVGRLLIPLHNLTTNTYRFGRGEGLIWIEFTKTTALLVAGQSSKNALGVTRRGTYTPFPQNKITVSPGEYLRRASPHSYVRSSIPEAVLQSRNQAEKAKQTTQWFATLGLVALVALAIGTWTLIHNTWKVADEVRHQLLNEGGSKQEPTRKIDELHNELRIIDKRATDEIAALKKRINEMAAEAHRVRTVPPPPKQTDESAGKAK